MNDGMEKFLIAALGSLLGFLLGLTAMRIKERRDRIARIRAMCMSVNLFSIQLREVLHEDSRLNAWLKIEALFQFLDLLDEPLAPSGELKDLIQIFSQWSRGFFLAGGIKSAACNSVKVDLQRVADGAQAKFEAAPRPLKAIGSR
jgi:hypothetical protein